MASGGKTIGWFAWAFKLEYFERALRDRLTAGTSSMDVQFPALEELQSFAQMLGRRLGEMHVLLAAPAKTSRFGMVETKAADATLWLNSLNERMKRALDILREYNSEESKWLVARAENIGSTLKVLAAQTNGEVRIRIHGNFGLALHQLLHRL